MVSSKAKTLKDYLAELPLDRRKTIEAVRKVIRANLDPKIVEMIQWGVISYAVPLSVYPPGYHCVKDTPLPFVALASQKNYYSVYLMNIYANSAIEKWFVKAYKATGKKLDMGKCCVRFKKLEDLPLDVIGKVIAKTTLKQHIAMYEKYHLKSRK